MQLPSFSEAVESVQKLAQASHPALAVQPGDTAQTGGVHPDIISERNKLWLNPACPVVPTQSLVRDMYDRFNVRIQELFHARFSNAFAVQILKPNHFLPAINAAEKELATAIGTTPVTFEAPPTMYVDQYNGKILMPEKFMTRTPVTNVRPNMNDFSAKFNVRQHEWDQAFLEQILFEQMGVVLFRQIRGEARLEMARCMQAVGRQFEKKISHVKSAIGIKMREMSIDEHPAWGIYTANDLINALQNRESQIAYRGVSALSKEMSLGEISLVDGLDAENGELQVLFTPMHPHFASKVARFEESNIRSEEE